MIKRYLQMIYLSFKFGTIIPFKIYMPLKIRIMKGATIGFQSRIVIGNSKKQARLSTNHVNLSLSKYSKLGFGNGVTLGPGSNIILKEGAELMIGNNSYITSDTHIEVVNKIQIGNDCAISWGVTIIDDNHHTLIVNGLEKESKKNVVIGNKVWIGCNVTILPGTIIGDNCVVAAGSVVKGTFNPNTLIAGNIATVIKENVVWK